MPVRTVWLSPLHLLRLYLTITLLSHHGRILNRLQGDLQSPLILLALSTAAYSVGCALTHFQSLYAPFYDLILTYLAFFTASVRLPILTIVSAASAAGVAVSVNYYKAVAIAVLWTLSSGTQLFNLRPFLRQVHQDVLLALAVCNVASAVMSDTCLRNTTVSDRKRPYVKKRENKSARLARICTSVTNIRAMRYMLLFAITMFMARFQMRPIFEKAGSRMIPWNLPQGYTLLEQLQGTTGLISVLEEDERKVRLMLSDHSILGGAYIEPGYEAETVFAQFHVHEAVRLTKFPGEPSHAQPGGRDGRALCIGMGMGVVSQALHTLGSDVDVVEIDAAVAALAKRHFAFNGPRVHIMDAKHYLSNAQQRVRNRSLPPYEYVVHDVFTGGAVPLSMFSVETFNAIRNVMTPDGVLALNFVGALDNPPTSTASRAVAAVRARLREVFEYVCAFSEADGKRVHNIVFFASNVKERMTFRQPTERDFLSSSNRRDALMSFQQRRLRPEQLGPRMPLKAATDHTINAGQWVTAKDHWKAMRNVLSADVWWAVARSSP